MPEEKGIKELKEAFIGVNELSLVLIALMKDGFQIVGDVVGLMKKISEDATFRTQLTEAVKGMTKIPAEIKDLSAAEGLDLAQLALGYVPKYIDAFKKEKAQ